MLIKGAVCIPHIPDFVGDVLTEEEVREALLFYQRHSKLVDVQHTLRSVGILLESYIIESPTIFLDQEYPKGSWFVSVDVDDEEIAQAILNGEYGGFSIFAAPYRSVDEMRRPMKPLPKGLKFRDVDSWKPTSISIIDEPSHPMARFEVYETENDFIQKWKPIDDGANMTEQNKNTEENNDGKIEVTESFIERLLGIGKSKPDDTEPPATPAEPKEDDIEARLTALEENDKLIGEKVDKILKLLDDDDEGKGDDQKPGNSNTIKEGEGIVKSNPNPDDNGNDNGNDNNIIDGPQGVSKSLDPDKLTYGKPAEGTLMERIGRTSGGLKKR